VVCKRELQGNLNVTHSGFKQNRGIKNMRIFIVLILLMAAGAGRATEVSDDFNRANTSYADSTTDPNPIGTQYKIVSGAGNGMSIAAGTLRGQSNLSMMYINTLETVNSDGNRFTFSADMYASSDSKSLMFNFQNTTNYNYFRYSFSSGVTTIQFVQLLNGANNIVITDYLTNAMTAATYYTMTVSSSNSVYNYSISELDGAVLYANSITNTMWTNGYAGFARKVNMDRFSLESSAQVDRPVLFGSSFTNGCILRRDRTIAVWGAGEPGETVTVEIKEQSKTATVDSNGDWRVELDPEPTGGPYAMTASGSGNSIAAVLTDIYFNSPQIRLANIFASGCVLQRDRTVAVWGFGEPDEIITVDVRSQSKSAAADGNGKWRVELDSEEAGGPFMMTISGTYSLPVILMDVYFGDVWILTGQSNMFQPLGVQIGRFSDYYPAVPDASDDFDDIRLAIVSVVSDTAPRADAIMALPWSRWQADALTDLSMVGYFFARFLNEQLDANGQENVPLGFIKVCKGSTRISDWTARAALDAAGEVTWDSTGGYYNGMIAPIQDYAIKGALWYQGEGNASSINRISQYPRLKQILVNSWREQWRNPDMPFYFVQLAPYHRFSTVPSDELWPWMRESQERCLAVRNTAMACIIDSGLQGDIHPPFKDRVGERLARIALAETYGIPIVSRGPALRDIQIDGADVVVTFDHVAAGLETRAVDSQPDADEIAAGFPAVSVFADTLDGFALCGEDRVFYWATQAQVISSNQVRISNATDVPAPAAVRYAWQNYPRCNLFNSEGLPAEPFRTDDFNYGASSGADSTPGLVPGSGLLFQIKTGSP